MVILYFLTTMCGGAPASLKPLLLIPTFFCFALIIIIAVAFLFPFFFVSPPPSPL